MGKTHGIPFPMRLFNNLKTITIILLYSFLLLPLYVTHTHTYAHRCTHMYTYTLSLLPKKYYFLAQSSHNHLRTVKMIYFNVRLQFYFNSAFVRNVTMGKSVTSDLSSLTCELSIKVFHYKDLL